MSKTVIAYREAQAAEAALRAQLAQLLDEQEQLAATTPNAADLLAHVDRVHLTDKRIEAVRAILQQQPAKVDQSRRAAIRERANAIAPALLKSRQNAAEEAEKAITAFENHLASAVLSLEVAFKAAGESTGVTYPSITAGDWNAIVAGAAVKAGVQNHRALAFTRSLVRTIGSEAVTTGQAAANYPRQSLMAACNNLINYAAQDAEEQARIELK